MVTVTIKKNDIKYFDRLIITESLCFIAKIVALAKWRNKINKVFDHNAMLNLTKDNDNIKPLNRW